MRSMRATRELLRAVGIVTRLTHRPAAAHDNTSRRAVASFSTTPLARRRDDGDAQRIMPALVRVSSLTDDADFDGVVPLLVEKLTNVIRAVDGSNPVAVVTSRNDEAARGMTRRRLEHQSGAVTLFPDLLSALSATRGQQAVSHRVETDINRSARKEFNYDAKFAGDVDVDDVELRCTKHDWAGEADSAIENLQRASPTATSTSFNAIVVHACDTSDEMDASDEMAAKRSLNVVVIDALSMLADHGDYGEGIPLDEKRIEKLKAADVVVMHHACLLPTPASTEAIERHLMEHVNPLGTDDDKKNSLNAPAVVRTRVRCVRTERLHRYAGASPAHEWTPPPSRLRGARVLGMTGCKRGDGRRRGLMRLLENMVAPAVDDTKNGYGLRLRRTGKAEVSLL